MNGHSPTVGLIVPDELVEAIARRVAELVPPAAAADPEPWLDVDGAARYLGYGDGGDDKLERGRRRVRDLRQRRLLRFEGDGTRLLTRREWIDDYLGAAK